MGQQQLVEYEKGLLQSSGELSSSSAPVVIPVLSEAATPATVSISSSSSVPVKRVKWAQQQQRIQRTRQRTDFEEINNCLTQRVGFIDWNTPEVTS